MEKDRKKLKPEVKEPEELKPEEQEKVTGGIFRTLTNEWIPLDESQGD